MSSKFNYPMGVDEIPRRLAELKQRGEENSAAVLKTVEPLVNEARQARDNINTLLMNLDERVNDSISRNSYTRAEIEERASTANKSILTPAHGGTGTNNAYNHDVGSTQRRAVWMDSHGTLGYALSSARGKRNIRPTSISADDLRAISIVDYQFIDDPEHAPAQIGVIAEQVMTHIPDSMIYLNSDGYSDDIDNPEDVRIEGVEISLFGILALRLAQLNADTIDLLTQRISELEDELDKFTRLEDK